MDIRTDRIIPIMDFMAPELDVYARLSENQLYHLYEPCLLYTLTLPTIA